MMIMEMERSQKSHNIAEPQTLAEQKTRSLNTTTIETFTILIFSLIALSGSFVSFLGCSDKGAGNDSDATLDAQSSDGGVDAQPIDGGEPDTGIVSPCSTDILLDTEIEIDPEGPDTQIHPSVSFDGESIWAVYNLPDEHSLFDVWGTRLNCNGEHSMDPTRLNVISEYNEVDPEVTCANGRAYVVWGADNGSGVNNMDIYYRTFELDGTPIMAEELSLETTRDGTPIHGNLMFPTVTAGENDSFWIAGIRGLEETGTFHFFLQKVLYDGELSGEALQPVTEPGVTHTYPSLASSAEGHVFMAWNRFGESEEDEIYHTIFLSGASEPEEPVLAIEGREAQLSAYWAGEINGVQRAVLAVSGTSGDILLTDGMVLDPSEGFMLVGDDWETDHSPSIAGGGSGGVVAFYRNISGLRNEVYIQPFTFSGENIVIEQERLISQGPAAPYGTALTYLGDGFYFLAWSQGISPDFRIVGMFFHVEH